MGIDSRYNPRRIYSTSNDLYSEDLEKRGLKYFRYYQTPVLKKPTLSELSDIEEYGHVWKLGDRYYKLAHEHYGDPEMWWVIAWYNNKPTEAHVKIGDVVKVPSPLWKIRAVYEV
jgi:hypothetical protein